MPARTHPDRSDDALLPGVEGAVAAAGEVGDPARTIVAAVEEAATAVDLAARERPSDAPPPAGSHRRGRPPGSKNRPRPGPGAVVRRPLADAAAPRAARRAAPAVPRRATGDRLTIEAMVATESPREPRLSGDGRAVAWTAEAAGARQVFALTLRSGVVRQVTASEKDVTDPQWSPDGTRLAYVRDGAIWIVGADGSRATVVTDHPAGSRAPRWSPDGRRIAFLSRRRGWDQAWVVDAPLPRRGRPPARERRPEPRSLTPSGLDVDEIAWSPDGTRLAIMAQRDPDLLTHQVAVLDVATGDERIVAGHGSWDSQARWLPDGSGLLLTSDEDGWFQVVRVAADGSQRTVLTSGRIEHGDYTAGFGSAPLPSPDGRQFVHVVVRDGFQELWVAPLEAAVPARRGPGRPPKHARPPADGRSRRVSPFDGVWLAVAWLPDSSGILAVGESERDPEDLWILPIPDETDAAATPAGAEGAAAGPGAGSDPGSRSGAPRARPRRLTSSRPAALAVGGFVEPERVTITARDGLAIPATLWRPPDATGKRGGQTVATVVHVHGGPTWQVYLDWQPLRQLLVQEGFALLSVDFRGSTGYGREFRWANRDEWGHADVHDVVDAARWAAAQPWSNGRLAMLGGSYGGYLTLCALVEEPALWAAGVDLYGDSEIADSYRHGDRVGRIDLHRMMGSPDDPTKAPMFRRGSPLYRAERIEAPLLILHGRKDKRVVPLMTEKMVEALEIEGKHHEVHWYADEGHGWERRENRRDAFGRIVGWLRRHLLDEPPKPD